MIKSFKIILFAVLTVLLVPLTVDTFADHPNISIWSSDREFDIQSSLTYVSHASFTPDADFEDAANIWNSVDSSWWDITRDDSSDDIKIGSWFMGWHTTTLAKTNYLTHNGAMQWAKVDFNNAKDFRDVTISKGLWSYDYETVAIYELGHVAGIHDHTETTDSPMNAHIPSNTVDRTLNAHDIATIGGMYQSE